MTVALPLEIGDVTPQHPAQQAFENSGVAGILLIAKALADLLPVDSVVGQYLGYSPMPFRCLHHDARPQLGILP